MPNEKTNPIIFWRGKKYDVNYPKENGIILQSNGYDYMLEPIKPTEVIKPDPTNVEKYPLGEKDPNYIKDFNLYLKYTENLEIYNKLKLEYDSLPTEKRVQREKIVRPNPEDKGKYPLGENDPNYQFDLNLYNDYNTKLSAISLGSIYEGDHIVGTTKADDIRLTQDIVVAGFDEVWGAGRIQNGTIFEKGMNLTDIMKKMFSNEIYPIPYWSEGVLKNTINNLQINRESINPIVELGTAVYLSAYQTTDVTTSCSIKSLPSMNGFTYGYGTEISSPHPYPVKTNIMGEFGTVGEKLTRKDGVITVAPDPNDKEKYPLGTSDPNYIKDRLNYDNRETKYKFTQSVVGPDISAYWRLKPSLKPSKQNPQYLETPPTEGQIDLYDKFTSQLSKELYSNKITDFSLPKQKFITKKGSNKFSYTMDGPGYSSMRSSMPQYYVFSNLKQLSEDHKSNLIEAKDISSPTDTTKTMEFAVNAWPRYFVVEFDDSYVYNLNEKYEPTSINLTHINNANIRNNDLGKDKSLFVIDGKPINLLKDMGWDVKSYSIPTNKALLIVLPLGYTIKRVTKGPNGAGTNYTNGFLTAATKANVTMTLPNGQKKEYTVFSTYNKALDPMGPFKTIEIGLE